MRGGCVFDTFVAVAGDAGERIDRRFGDGRRTARTGSTRRPRPRRLPALRVTTMKLSAAASAQLIEALEQIAAAHSHLTPKSADLQSQLAERQRQTESDFPF